MNLKTLDKAKIAEMIEEMAKIIVDQFHPDKIILFGSHAKGDAGPDSDVDLLVVIRVDGSCREKANEIDLALADRSLPLDLIVVTPERFENDRAQLGTIIRPASNEGKVLYDTAG